jgi:hypothetical protein
MLFISDLGGGGLSDYEDGKVITANESCITLRCFMELDGPTELAMGAPEDVAFGGAPAFDGIMDTPNRVVVISTILWNSVLAAAVPDTKTRIRIWINHPTEPDRIGVGLN